MKPQTYERPSIKTVRAAEIVESMGPVSCGSGGGVNPLPFDEGPSSTGNGPGHGSVD